MRTESVALADVLTLVREPVTIRPDETYRSIGVRGFGRGLISYPPVPGSELGRLRYFKLSPNRLVVSNIKAWEGAVTTTRPDESGRIASNRFLTYASDCVDIDYVAHYLQSDEGLAKLGKASPGSADRNRTLSIKNFEAIEIPLPPLREQRRIAAHLARVTAAASKADSVATRELGLITALLHRSWSGESVQLGELVKQVARPITVTSDTIYDMHGVRWYGAGLFLRERRVGRDLGTKTVYKIQEGDLIYNRLFAWKQSFAIVGDAASGTVSNEFPTFRIDTQQVRPRVLLALLLSGNFGGQVNSASTGSTPTSRNRLKEKDFLRLTVELPPLPAQEMLERILIVLDRLRAVSDRKQSIQKALLPAARNEIFSAMR